MLRVTLRDLDEVEPWIVECDSVGAFLASYFDGAGHRAVDSAAVEQLEEEAVAWSCWSLPFDRARVDHMVGEWCGHEFATWQVVAAELV